MEDNELQLPTSEIDTSEKEQRLGFLELSFEQRREIEKIKQENGFKGSTQQIIQDIQQKHPELDGGIEEHVNSVPAFGDRETKTLYVNIEIISPPHDEILMEHEAVELYFRQSELDEQEVGTSLGTLDIMTEDWHNGPEHYVALYHELKLAKEKGVLDEHIALRKQTIERNVDELKRIYKEEGEENWEERAESSAQSYRKQTESVEIISKLLK